MFSFILALKGKIKIAIVGSDLKNSVIIYWGI